MLDLLEIRESKEFVYNFHISKHFDYRIIENSRVKIVLFTAFRYQNVLITVLLEIRESKEFVSRIYVYWSIKTRRNGF